MSPKCVIFDFGNVIAFFDHRKACRKLSKLSNDQFTEDEIYNELFQTGGLEQKYDRGEITSEKFLNEIKQKFEILASIEEIQTAWCDIFFPNKLVIDLLKRLKQKQHRLMLASNTNELHYQWIKERFADALALFDAEIISFKIGFRKPELEFFDHCI
ncbi:MAG: HAD family hydrolase [Gammaproteobacteria bacterium]